MVEEKKETPGKNRNVFLEVKVGEDAPKKIIIELYDDVVPRTAENFFQLCSGDFKYGYEGSIFHRIIPGFMAQGGDFIHRNGTGGESIYGRTFKDENFKKMHFKRGILSMANSGKHSNSSQFFITFSKTSWLDNMHVVFGEVIKDQDNLLEALESIGTRGGTPTAEATIISCGEEK